MQASVTTTPIHGKRVAMVLFSYYPGDPRPRRAAEALAAAGAEVELICLREKPGELKRETINGVRVRRVPMARRRGGVVGYLYRYCAFLVASSAIISARLLTKRYDLVYVHNMPDFLVLCGLIPKLFGAKIILDLHDPMPELMQTIFELPPHARSVQLLRGVERWSMKLADAVITVNAACARLFASRSCSAKKITVVMNSPDETIFESRPVQKSSGVTNSKPFVIMYHGSIVERNGLALAMEAFARVRPELPSAELHIYGSRNALLERVMETAEARGLQGSVQYLGQKPLEQIVEAIASCDLGIIPNQRSIFTELNTPTRIFEYLALGKPVIAPKAPGITDYFDENSLIFFELGNADDLARKIALVYRNREEVAEITRRGQQVHFAHTWRVEKTQLTRLVEGMVSGRLSAFHATATEGPQER